MLGELIGEGKGKRVVRRVVSSDPVTIEVSFEGAAKMFGVDAMEIGTYTSTVRADGTLHGEGAGVVMTLQGEAISWKGTGVGTFKERGAVAYRGALTYQTAAERFKRLNSVAGVFEFEADENGNTTAKVWEWK